MACIPFGLPNTRQRNNGRSGVTTQEMTLSLRAQAYFLLQTTSSALKNTSSAHRVLPFYSSFHLKKKTGRLRLVQILQYFIFLSAAQFPIRSQNAILFYGGKWVQEALDDVCDYSECKFVWTCSNQHKNLCTSQGLQPNERLCFLSTIKKQKWHVTLQQGKICVQLCVQILYEK